MNIFELEQQIEVDLLHKRFTLKELADYFGGEISLGGNDISASNIADYDFMCEYKGFDIDIYCLIDRYGQYYITEIGVNYQ